jgi:hypothetical protein
MTLFSSPPTWQPTTVTVRAKRMLFSPRRRGQRHEALATTIHRE